jgi:small-conductance mechanosensitive channel
MMVSVSTILTVFGSQLGRAFDTMFTFFFYVVLFVTIVAIMGLDPFVMIASFSGFIVGFAFMINIACSSWVQGILLILVRRPYDIGDRYDDPCRCVAVYTSVGVVRMRDSCKSVSNRIHISNPWVDTDNTGSPGWIVKDIDLFSTTVVLGATNEVATYNNGSLANFRIINAARSHKAVMAFEMKFPINCPYEKIQLFRKVVEEFVRARPREVSEP